MHPPQASTSSAMNIEQFQQTAMNVVEAFCGILAMPVEIILRPWYGTRYFPIMVTFFSAVLMIVLPAFTAMGTAVVGMIPFGPHVARPVGIFDIGSLAELYFLLSFVHSIRLWRRMIHMEREEHSEFEGPPLPFFYLLPKGHSFWFTRIVLEPAFVLVGATILENLRIVQSGLSTYLHLVALALAMKNFIGWYRAWEFIRTLLDSRNADPLSPS